ncbi:MAG: cardiolipin synthase, partial [Deltaproteobacteria bacterium]
MSHESLLGAILLALDISLQIVFVVRVLLRPHREPTSRIAWVVVIVAVPLLGILAYLLFGEICIGRRRVERLRESIARLPVWADTAAADMMPLQDDMSQRYLHLF